MTLQELQVLFGIIALTAVCLVNSQYPPQRLAIPGAVPAPVARPIVRTRRPAALKSQNFIPNNIAPRVLEESKPVTESAEDDEPDSFLPQLVREQQIAQAQQAQFQQTAAAFFNSEQDTIHEKPISHLLSNDEPNSYPTRSSERSSSPTIATINNLRFNQDKAQAPVLSHAVQNQRERNNVIRNRQTDVREYGPQFVSQPVAVQSHTRTKPVKSRPITEQNQIQLQDRDIQHITKRPVAQTIRKWSEENEDGSITWGYENDDGSFKEELIGTDCVTKGTYGYVDPDGNKREYHYETGIKCDPNKRYDNREIQDHGSINYEENRAVLPNGIEIDMSQLGKKKSNRPGVNYRN